MSLELSSSSRYRFSCSASRRVERRTNSAYSCSLDFSAQIFWIKTRMTATVRAGHQRKPRKEAHHEWRENSGPFRKERGVTVRIAMIPRQVNDLGFEKC